MNKTRLEAFSDGVIAIIITIMVLEIKVPHGTGFRALTPLIPVFYSYVISFLFVGIYWGNHHHLIHTVKRVNAKMIWANLHLLFWLSLVPFSTGWMGENHFAETTIIVYAINLLLCGVAYTILQVVIEKNSIGNVNLEQAFRKVRAKGTFSMCAYTAAIPLAMVNTTFSAIIFLLVAIVWLIPDKNIEKALAE